MASPYAQVFFSPQEPPPAFTRRPDDPGLVQRVEKVSEFARRNGPEFVRLIESKQRSNPEYSFLFKGYGYDYYIWYLYCTLWGLPTDPSTQETTQQQTEAKDDVLKGFNVLLDKFDGRKESTRDCHHFFSKHPSHAADLAASLHDFVDRVKDGDRRLDIVHMIDDILTKSRGLCTEQEQGDIAEGLRPYMREIFNKTLLCRPHDGEFCRRLMRVLSSWDEWDVYDVDFIEDIKKELYTLFDRHVDDDERDGRGYGRRGSESSRRRRRSPDSDTGTTRRSSSGFSSHPSMTKSASSQSDRGARTTKFEGMPQEGNRSSIRSRSRAAFDPPPTQSNETTVDCFSFPAGRIPDLVAEKHKHSFSYTPISPLDIQKHSYRPKTDSSDSYLKSRIEKFYAELEEYRPGMVREDVELRKHEDDADVPVEPRRRPIPRTFALTEEGKLTSMLPDGSFAGEGSETNYAGLGMHSTSRRSEEEKAFDAFRKLRSDVYHHVAPKPPSNTGR